MTWEHGNDTQCENVQRYFYIFKKWVSLHCWWEPGDVIERWEDLGASAVPGRNCCSRDERHLKILFDIHQREWYMIRSSLFSVSTYHPLYLTWTSVLSFVDASASAVWYVDKNWLLAPHVHTIYTLTIPWSPIYPSFVFPFNNFLGNTTPFCQPPLHNEDHCLATTRRRVGRRTGPRMKRWSNSCHHLSPPLQPTECGGISMRVFTLRLRCVLPRLGRRCKEASWFNWYGNGESSKDCKRVAALTHDITTTDSEGLKTKVNFGSIWHSLTWKLAKMAQQQACMTMFPWARLVICKTDHECTLNKMSQDMRQAYFWSKTPIPQS